MSYINELTEIEKCPGGMSPAEVYRCKHNEQTVILKTINLKYENTTYSVRREAQVMQWLSERLTVPKVLEYSMDEENQYLIMSELSAKHIDSYVSEPEKYISYLAKAIQAMQRVTIEECPFDSSLDVRLKELEYLMNAGLADKNMEHWEQMNQFTSPEALFEWLCNNRPTEELVFSHGDIASNFMINDETMCFYDLARAGKADRWNDIALCVRNIREYYPGTEYETMFFELLKLTPDYKKIDYYLLLDELF